MSEVKVRISRRVLWIGGDAYPLQNVARAATVRERPGRISDLPAVLGCLVVLFVPAVGLVSAATWLHHMYVVAIAPWALLGLALVFRLVVRATKRPVYCLIIETSGSSSTVMTSTNKDCLDRIVWAIMDAIDNPGAEYRVQV